MNISLSIDKQLGFQGQRGIGGFNVGGIQEQDNRQAKLYKASKTDGSKLEAYTNPQSDEAKQWSGWGTALKPAYEPIVLARKPILEQNIAQNVLKWGVGGINIDECRVGDDIVSVHNAPKGTFAGGEQGRGSDTETYREHAGRFPANIIHDGSEEVVSGFPNEDYEIGGSPSRFFYTAKASQEDRNEGLEIATITKNTHPTVKPTDLMRYLVRLITPNGGTCLDLFMGSGSTGKALVLENAHNNKNYHFIGIDMTPEYVEIAKARIEYAINNPFNEAKVVEVDGNKVLDKPISLFDD